MSRVAGVELDSTSLRMAIFEGSPKQFRLVEYIDEPLAGESAEERAALSRDVLKGVLSRKENLGLEMVSSIDARHVVLREISVPYLRDDHIDRTIRFEAENYLHAQTIEEVVVEYLKCSEAAGASRLILCMVPKKVISDHLAQLKENGIDPLAIELDATALATSFSNTPLFSGEQNVLLIEIEATYSRLVLLEKNRIVKIRTFWDRAVRRADRLLGEGGSGEAATGNGATAPSDAESEAGSRIERRFEEIERTLSRVDRPDPGDAGPFDPDGEGDDLPICVVPDDEYETLLESPASGSGAGSAQGTGGNGGAREPRVAAPALALAGARAESPLERIFVEIERTFAGYALGGRIDLMVVTGSRAASLDAVPRLTEHFETEVVPFDLGDSFPIEWSGSRELLNQRGAVACGLGLRALGKGLTRFDLRRDEFKFERRFEQLMLPLVLASLLLWAFTLLWSSDTYIAKRRAEKEVTRLLESQRDLYHAFFGEEIDPKSPPSQAARKRLETLKGRGAPGLKQYFTVMDLLQDITRAAAEARVQRDGGKGEPIYPVWLEIDINPEINKNSTSKIKLKVKSTEEYTALESALKQHLRSFTVSESSSEAFGKGGEFEASFKLKFQDSKLPKPKGA